jgi:hypothetical protein
MRALTPSGLEIVRGYAFSLTDEAGELGVSWVRYNGIHWSAVERTQGNCGWAALRRVKAELLALRGQRLHTHVVIRGTYAENSRSYAVERGSSKIKE